MKFACFSKISTKQIIRSQHQHSCIVKFSCGIYVLNNNTGMLSMISLSTTKHFDRPLTAQAEMIISSEHIAWSVCKRLVTVICFRIYRIKAQQARILQSCAKSWIFVSIEKYPNVPMKKCSINYTVTMLIKGAQQYLGDTLPCSFQPFTGFQPKHPVINVFHNQDKGRLFKTIHGTCMVPPQIVEDLHGKESSKTPSLGVMPPILNECMYSPEGFNRPRRRKRYKHGCTKKIIVCTLER